MTRIVVVSAGLSSPSATRLLADRLADRVAAELSTGRSQDVAVDPAGAVSTEVVELRGLAHQLVDNMLTGFPTGDLADAIDTVGGADALIVVTPVFAASYSGLFKMFFDVLDPDLLRGKPVLLAATAGTARHSLVLEHALRPLLAHMGAVTVPTAVFAATDDWARASAPGSGAESPLDERIRRAATDLAGILNPGSGRRVAPAGHRRWSQSEAFTGSMEFGELLARARFPETPAARRPGRRAG